MWRSTTPHWTWEGDVLVGRSTVENPLDENSFFIWEDDVENFILKASFDYLRTFLVFSAFKYREESG